MGSSNNIYEYNGQSFRRTFNLWTFFSQFWLTQFFHVTFCLLLIHYYTTDSLTKL